MACVDTGLVRADDYLMRKLSVLIAVSLFQHGSTNPKGSVNDCVRSRGGDSVTAKLADAPVCVNGGFIEGRMAAVGR